MTQLPRPYSGIQDLYKIQTLMRDGLRAFPYGYMHPCDIEWWFFYNPTGESIEDTTFLWENEAGELLGWVTSLVQYAEYDLFMHPSQRGTPLEREMIAWIEERLSSQVEPSHSATLETGTVFEEDMFRRAVLVERGYVAKPHLVLFSQPLGALPSPTLPSGFSFLPFLTPADADKRTSVHVSAFVTSRMTEAYYQQFMATAPSYRPENDVVSVEESSGLFTSFAMTWHDDILKRGEFEPVGTRATHQRRGLGRATLYEGLRRMKQSGMTEATVCCDATDAGTIAFYESAGFIQRANVFIYSKPLK